MPLLNTRRKKEKKPDEENRAPVPASEDRLVDDVYADPQAVDDMFETLLGPNNLDLPEKNIESLLNIRKARKVQLIEHYQAIGPTLQSPRASGARNSPAGYLQELRVLLLSRVAETQAREEDAAAKKTRSRSHTWSSMRKLVSKSKTTKEKLSSTAKLAEFLPSLRVAISSQPIRWFKDFIEQNAIDDLTRLLASSCHRLYSPVTPVEEHEQEGTVQFEAVKCLKLSLNNQTGINYILARPDLRSKAFHLLTLSLDAQIEKTKIASLELLCVMAVFFHSEILTALEEARDEEEPSKFSKVVSFLKGEKSSVALKTNALSLMNSLMHCKEADKKGIVSMQHLKSLRSEFFGLGVDSILLDLHEKHQLPRDPEEEVVDKRLRDLRIQMVAFHEEIEEPTPSAEADDEYEQMEIDEEDGDFLSSSEPSTREALTVLEEHSENAEVAEALKLVRTLQKNEQKKSKKIASLKRKLGSACEENQILREGKEALEGEFKKLVEEVRGLRAIYDVVEGALEEKEVQQEKLQREDVSQAPVALKPAGKPLPQRLDIVKVSEVLDGVLRSPCSPFAGRMKKIPRRQMFENQMEERESPPLDELEESFEPWQHYQISNIDVRGLPRMESHLLQDEIGTWRGLYEDLSQEHRQLQEEHADANIKLAQLKVNLLADIQVMSTEIEHLSKKVQEQQEDIERLELAKAAAENARNASVCGRIAELQEHLQEVMAENSALQERLDTAMTDMAQLEEAYQATSAMLIESELKKEADTNNLSKTCQQLGQKLDMASSRLEESKAARERLEEQKAQLERSVAEKDQQLAAIHEQLNGDGPAEEFDINTLKMEISNLKCSRTSLEEAADQLSREKIELSTQLRELQEETSLSIEDLQRVLEETLEELEDLREEKETTKGELRQEIHTLHAQIVTLTETHEAEMEEIRATMAEMEKSTAVRVQEIENAHEVAVEEIKAEMAAAIEEEKESTVAATALLEQEFREKILAAKGEIKEEEQSAAKRELECKLREMKAAMAEEKEEVRKELQVAKETEAAAMAAFEEKKKELLEQMEAFKKEKAAFDEVQDAIKKEKEEKERKEREEKEAQAKAAAEAEAAAIAAAKAAPPPPPMPMIGGGGPPPPPGAPGMPPPPPMMGARAVQQILPEGCDKVPSVKVKGLQWKKIAPYKAAGTVFAVAKTPDDVSIPVKDLERLFCAAPAKKSTGSNTVEDSEAKEKNSKKPVSLLDPRRAQNIAILLSSLKATYKKVRNAIIAMDSEFLQPSTLRQLIKLAPTPEEMDMVRSFQEQNPNAILGSAETFFLTIDAIPALQERLTAMLFKHDLMAKVPELQSELELLRSTTLQVQKAEHFPSLLKVLLHFGNFMNGGTFRGKAAGFQLSSILSLKDTRANEGRGTLLHFIVNYIYEKHEELVKFADELSLTEKASRLSFPTISEEVAKLRQQLTSNIGAVANVEQCNDIDGAPEDVFSTVMATFLEEAAPKIALLEALQQSTAKEFLELATFYGETDPSRVQPNEFFHTLHSFRTQFLLARREKELEEERKEKEKTRQKEREKRRQSLLQAAKSRNSPRVSLRADGVLEEESSEEGVVDNIFAQIRGGDFNRARRRSSIVRNRAPRQSLSYTGQMGEVSAASLRRQSLARSLVCSPPNSPATKALSPSNGKAPAPGEDKEVFAIFNNIKKKRASRLSQISARSPAVV